MKVLGSVHCDIELDDSDYFLAQPDDNGSVKIILTDSKRRPLNLRRVSRRQIYNLVAQVQRVVLLQDTEAAETIEVDEFLVGETITTPSRKEGVHEESLARTIQ